MDKPEKHNSIDYYFDDINRCQHLTQAQINSKIEEINSLKHATNIERINKLRSEIAESNLKLVIKFAKEYQNVGVSLADLIQEGNIGLLRAIDKFDPKQGIKFSTLAGWWIKECILRAIKYDKTLIRTPTYVQESLARIAKARAAYEKEIGAEPSLEYLANQEGLSEEELEKLYNISMDPVSLEAVVHGEVQKSLKDFIPDNNIDLDKSIDSSRLSEDISAALDAHLTAAEKEVMILRFGLFNETAHTLEECAGKMNKSREHIRQLETSGKDKLKALAAELDNYR